MCSAVPFYVYLHCTAFGKGYFGKMGLQVQYHVETLMVSYLLPRLLKTIEISQDRHMCSWHQVVTVRNRNPLLDSISFLLWLLCLEPPTSRQSKQPSPS